MRIPRRYLAKDLKYRMVPKVIDNTVTGPRPYVGQPPKTNQGNADDYSCWTDRSFTGLRDNDQKTPLDYIDVDKPQGM